MDFVEDFVRGGVWRLSSAGVGKWKRRGLPSSSEDSGVKAPLAESIVVGLERVHWAKERVWKAVGEARSGRSRDENSGRSLWVVVIEKSSFNDFPVLLVSYSSSISSRHRFLDCCVPTILRWRRLSNFSRRCLVDADEHGGRKSVRKVRVTLVLSGINAEI